MNNELYNCLQWASSQDPNLVKQAEQNLTSWAKEPNFYSTILSVFTNSQMDVGVRYMAILQLKNGIERHWRKLQAK